MPIQAIPATFNATVFQPYKSAPTSVSTKHDETVARISYCNAKHGDHANFCRSQDFALYENQVEESLYFLIDFCMQKQMSCAARIANNFNIFLRHRFGDSAFFFWDNLAILDSVGKQSLDQFCAMIRDECINNEIKKIAIQNLSEGMVACAGGTISNLVCAEQELAKAAGGLRGKVWDIKEKTIRDILHEECKKFHRDRNNIIINYPRNLYTFDECGIHFVNAAWNAIADKFGLKKIMDEGADLALYDMNLLFLNSCATKVRNALTPDQIAYLIAEECLQYLATNIFNNTSKNKTSFIKLNKLSKTPLQLLEDISDKLGVSATVLNAHHFFKFDEKAETLSLQNDPTLIATDILRAMDASSLLKTYPVNIGCWQEEPNHVNSSTALFRYGQLAWLAKGNLTEIRQVKWNDFSTNESCELKEALQSWKKTLHEKIILWVTEKLPSQSLYEDKQATFFDQKIDIFKYLSGKSQQEFEHFLIDIQYPFENHNEIIVDYCVEIIKTHPESSKFSLMKLIFWQIAAQEKLASYDLENVVNLYSKIVKKLNFQRSIQKIELFYEPNHIHHGDVADQPDPPDQSVVKLYLKIIKNIDSTEFCYSVCDEIIFSLKDKSTIYDCYIDFLKTKSPDIAKINSLDKIKLSDDGVYDKAEWLNLYFSTIENISPQKRNARMIINILDMLNSTHSTTTAAAAAVKLATIQSIHFIRNLPDEAHRIIALEYILNNFEETSRENNREVINCCLGIVKTLSSERYKAKLNKGFSGKIRFLSTKNLIARFTNFRVDR